MKTSSKIFLTIFTILIVGLTIFGFIVFKGRKEASDKIGAAKKQTNQPSINSSAGQNSVDTPSTTNNISNNNQVADPTTDDNAVDESTPAETNNYIDISRSDCDSQCKNFIDSTELKYCQQICGLTPIKKNAEEKKGCDALSDLDKDYCLKDLAIAKKDIEICKQIDDTNVLKTCKNRIAQDLLESKQ